MEENTVIEQPERAMAVTEVVHQIPIDKLQPFQDHAFKPYRDKRFAQMAQSIRENGIFNPVIVRQTRIIDYFEIVSGHNRVKAAEGAGLHVVPVIIRDLSDDEAMLQANEANITQRNFND